MRSTQYCVSCPLVQGQTLGWGGALREIEGGGEVRVTSLSHTGAELAYYLLESTPLVAGGGKLGAGGTVLFTPDGRIVKIPPGDPFERRIAPIVEQVSSLFARIRNLRGFEHVAAPALHRRCRQSKRRARDPVRPRRHHHAR